MAEPRPGSLMGRQDLPLGSLEGRHEASIVVQFSGIL